MGRNEDKKERKKKEKQKCFYVSHFKDIADVSLIREYPVHNCCIALHRRWLRLKYDTSYCNLYFSNPIIFFM